GEDAAEISHAGGRLHRPILHYYADVVLSDLVPGVFAAGAAYVHTQGRIRRRNSRTLRWVRRYSGRHHFRPPAARRLLVELRAQVAHHGGHDVGDDHDCLQLCQRPEPYAVVHVHFLLRQGAGGAGMDGGLRYFSQGAGGYEWGAVQLHRQHGRHHHADYHWVYCRED